MCLPRVCLQSLVLLPPWLQSLILLLMYVWRSSCRSVACYQDHELPTMPQVEVALAAAPWANYRGWLSEMVRETLILAPFSGAWEKR